MLELTRYKLNDMVGGNQECYIADSVHHEAKTGSLITSYINFIDDELAGGSIPEEMSKNTAGNTVTVHGNSEKKQSLDLHMYLREIKPIELAHSFYFI